MVVYLRWNGNTCGGAVVTARWQQTWLVHQVVLRRGAIVGSPGVRRLFTISHVFEAKALPSMKSGVVLWIGGITEELLGMRVLGMLGDLLARSRGGRGSAPVAFSAVL